MPAIISPGATLGAPSGSKPAKPAPFDASAFQTTLNQHGYAIPVDGINGPLTQAAATAFRSHTDPAAFNVAHGLTAGPKAAAPKRVAVPAKVSGQIQAPAAKTPTAANPPAAKAPAPAAGPAAASSPLGALSALIQQAQQGAVTEGQQGQSLINGYTQNAENQLKGIDLAAPFTQAAGDQNAINTALMAALTGQGSTLQGQLAGQLAGTGQSPALSSALTGNLGTTTTGAAGAGLANGDASLSQLLQSGAAAGSYGKKLPALTALAGLQDTKALQGQVGANEAKTVSALEAKAPGLLQSQQSLQEKAAEADASNRLKDSQDNIANQLKEQGLTETANYHAGELNATNAKTRAEASYQQAVVDARVAAQNATNAYHSGQLTIDQYKAQTDRIKAKLTEAKAAATAAAPSSSLSRTRGVLTANDGQTIVGQDGKPQVLPGFKYNATGNVVKAPSSSALSKPGGMTQNEWSTVYAKVSSQADDFFNGVPPKKSATGVVESPGKPPVLYPQAFREIQATHPTMPAKRILAILNIYYPPGVGGRPKSAAQIAAMTSAPLTAKVGPTGPFGFQAVG